MESRYNRRSPAVRRLMREAIELRDPTSLYHAQPLEENLFEWHFTIRGPPGTDYEGGRYHGRILLPPEYPMKPPSIVILTPNGRFELNQKICLSASSYHPELWQASWGIRTMLLALIGFMPTDGFGTIGSLECPSEVRRNLAQRSLDWVCPSCGVANRTALPEGVEGEDKEKTVAKEVEEIVSQMAIKSEEEVDARFKQQIQAEKSSQPSQASISPDQSNDMVSSDEATLPNTSETNGLRQRRSEMPTAVPATIASTQVSSVESETSSNSFILLLIVMLIIAIVVLVIRRLAFM